MVSEQQTARAGIKMRNPLSNDLAALSSATRAFIDKEKELFIDGEWSSGGVGKFPITDPSSGEPLGDICIATKAEVDRAVDAARKAFEGWRAAPPDRREELLRRLAELVKANEVEFAELESVDVGKPIAHSSFLDVPLSIEVLNYTAGLATKLSGQMLNPSMKLFPGQRFVAYTRQEPRGVVAAIIPWNFPLLVAVMKVAPALAAGCTVVLKPAEDASMTSLRLAELTVETGFPNGVINVVTGDGPTTGRALINNPSVDMIAFTGSTSTGTEIGRAAAEGIRDRILELGGKSPVVVMADANLDLAAETAAAAILFNTGQDCTAGSRLLVQRQVFDKVLDKVVQLMRKVRIAAPLDKEAEMGPLISQRQFDRVMGYITSGVQEGAELLMGGKRHGETGFYVEPTVFINARPKARIVCEEIFGPVLVVQSFDDLDEALEIANDTHYGLGASFWSTNPAWIQQAAEKIESGTVWVNTHGALDPCIPFGGYKRSGLGREFGEISIRNFTQTKSVVMRV